MFLASEPCRPGLAGFELSSAYNRMEWSHENQGTIAVEVAVSARVGGWKGRIRTRTGTNHLCCPRPPKEGKETELSEPRTTCLWRGVFYSEGAK